MSVAPCRPKKNEFAWQIIGSQVVFLRLRLHRLGPHLGCPVFCFFDVQVKTKNSLQNYIYMLYILITIIQRSAVFRRSDIHPATCTLPSLRQAPAVFSFASETATCNTSHTIRNESWSDSIFVLKVDLSGFNSIPSAIFSRPPINTLTVKDWYTYLY